MLFIRPRKKLWEFELGGYLRKQIQSQGKWREEHQEGCDDIRKRNQAKALGLRSSGDQIRAADKGKEHLLKRVLLKAIKSGQGELCLWGIGLKIRI